MKHLLWILLCPVLAFAQVTPTIPTGTVLGNSSGFIAAPSAQPTGKIINVLQNGVICDNATDNSAALATIATLAVTGSTIFFPPAPLACLISTPITLTHSGVTIWAYPGTVTLGPTSTNVSTPLLLKTNSQNNITVHGLTFDGGGSQFGAVTPNNPCTTDTSFSGSATATISGTTLTLTSAPTGIGPGIVYGATLTANSTTSGSFPGGTVTIIANTSGTINSGSTWTISGGGGTWGGNVQGVLTNPGGGPICTNVVLDQQTNGSIWEDNVFQNTAGTSSKAAVALTNSTGFTFQRNTFYNIGNTWVGTLTGAYRAFAYQDRSRALTVFCGNGTINCASSGNLPLGSPGIISGNKFYGQSMAGIFLTSASTIISTTVTAASASISATNYFAANTPVVFAGSMASVTGLTLGTTYYVNSTGLSGSAFQVCVALGCGGGSITPGGSGTATPTVSNPGSPNINSINVIGNTCEESGAIATPSMPTGELPQYTVNSIYIGNDEGGYAPCIGTNQADSINITGNLSSYAVGNGMDLFKSSNLNISGNTVRYSGEAGIGFFSGTSANISGNYALNNAQQFPISGLSPPFTGGISLSTQSTNTTNVNITGNTLVDNQLVPTQQYGVMNYTGGSGFTLSNLNIGIDNTYSGNVVATTQAGLPLIAGKFSGITDTGTAADQLQSGSVAQRPTACVLGQTRLNTDYGAWEYCSVAGSPGTWRLVSGTVTLPGCSGGQVSQTNVAITEQNLASCKIPANAMGANGQLRFSILWLRTVPTTDSVTWTIRQATTAGAVSGGSPFWSQANITSGVTGLQQVLIFGNTTSAANQAIAFNSSATGALTGTLAAAPNNPTINTAVDQYYNLNCTTGTQSVSDTCGVYHWSVEMVTP